MLQAACRHVSDCYGAADQSSIFTHCPALTEPDRLTGASVEIAGRGEVHEMSNENGVMKMRELERGVEIRPGQTVELKPGGFHLMFMDLKAGLKEGDTIRGTLVFEKAGTVPVTFRVGGLGARNAPEHAHH